VSLFCQVPVKPGPRFTSTAGESQLGSLISEIVVRDETDADVAAIRDVTVAAFDTLEISNHTEQFINAAPDSAGAGLVNDYSEGARCHI